MQDRWNPCFVTIASATPRTVYIEMEQVDGPADAIQIRQRVVAQSSATVYALEVPLTGEPSRVVFTLRDAQTDQTLATCHPNIPVGGNSAADDLRVIASGEPFIVYSGSLQHLSLFRRQFTQADFTLGVLPLNRLPAHSIGYDAPDLLILGGADLRDMSIAQQQAVLQWVDGGGHLLVWPGIEPLPAQSALLEALPAGFGVITDYAIPAAGAVGDEDILRLPGRVLSPRAHARSLGVGAATRPSDDPAEGFVISRGLGQIAVIPMDLSPLIFHNAPAAAAFWHPLLTGLASPRDTYQPPPDIDDPTAPVTPVSRTMDRLGVSFSPPRSQSVYGWFVAVGLIGLLAGPIDSVVLFALNRPPRTWVTLAGWGGVIVGAIGAAIMHRPPPVVQTASLMLLDQTDDRVISRSEFDGIHAPARTAVALNIDPLRWWRSLPRANAEGAHAIDFAVLHCQEDQQGNWPDQLFLSGGSTRFVRSDQAVNRAPILRASLHRSGDQIAGEIENTGDAPLQNPRIICGNGFCDVTATIASGQSAHISSRLMPISSMTDDFLSDVEHLTPAREKVIAQLLKDDNRACVLATVDTADAPVVAAGEQSAVHLQVIRAMVLLQP